MLRSEILPRAGVAHGWRNTVPEAVEDRLRARRLVEAERNVGLGMVGAAVGALLTVLVFGRGYAWLTVPWCSVAVAMCILRWRVSARLLASAPIEVPASAERGFLIWSFFYPLVLACVPLYLVTQADGMHLSFILTFCLGLLWCGALVHAPFLPASVVFMIVYGLASVVATLTQGVSMQSLALVLLHISGVGLVAFVVIRHARLFVKIELQALDLETHVDLISFLLDDNDAQSSNWLWKTDTEHRIVEPSWHFEEATGISMARLAGQRLTTILAPDGTPKAGTGLASIRSLMQDQAPFRNVVVPYHAQGRRLWLSVSGRPTFSQGGRFLGYWGIMADITTAKEAEDRILHLAHHDALTGLPNRARFSETLDEWLASGRTFAVFGIDLDGFKTINDCYGHPVGDELLRMVAQRLRLALRAGDVVSRLGGDEFCAQVWIDTPDAAAERCEQIIAALDQPFAIGGILAMVGASIGVVFAPAHGEDGTTLIKNADAALYRAKTEGRGTWRIFSPDLAEALVTRQSLLQGLRVAMANGEFLLHYQPIVSTASGRVSGFEALIRWQHPVRGLISPADFVPLLEESGLIVPVGVWVMEQACREAAGWPDETRVSVNISPVQFRENDLPEQISAALAQFGLRPDRLEVEITESVLMQDAEAALAILGRIRALGVRVALDDFGTGYSSLHYLRLFQFDRIKIDRSFIRELGTRHDCQVIVHAIRDIARALDMSITAEGVETEDQLAFLKSTGCQELQGFLFSPPHPATDVVRLLARPFAPTRDTRPALTVAQ